MIFAEAAATLPAVRGKRIHVSTLWRWATKGVRGVKLEAVRLGSRWMTSSEALERFAQQIADRTRADLAADADADLVSPVTDKAIRDLEIERAERSCDRAGIRG